MHVRSKNNVMLAELVIVVLFFSLIAVIVTQMFVATAQRGKLNQRTQIALMHAQDAAEMLIQVDAPPTALRSDGYTETAPGIFEKTTADGIYRIRVSLSHEQISPVGTLSRGRIAVLDETRKDADADAPPMLVELPLASYSPRQEVAL